MALDETTSYATLAEADARIALTRLHDVWDLLADLAKEGYLRDGRRLMDDIVVYPGFPTESGKPWPRQGVPLRFGRGEYVDSDTIPPDLGEANALQAAAMAVEDRESDDVVETQGISGSDGTMWRGDGGRKVISDRVRDLLHGSGYGYVPHKYDVRVGTVLRG